MKSFLQPLHNVRRSLLRRRCIAAVMLIFLAGGAFLLASNLVAKATGMQESTALWWVPGTLILAIITSAAWMVRLHRQQPTVRDLAEQVEAAHPELLDSFNTAVDLCENPTIDSPSSVFHEALFTQVARQTESLNWPQLLIGRHLRTASLLLLCALLILTSFALVRTDMLRKAHFAFNDLLHGTQTGMTLLPSPMQAALGSDLTLRVQLHRWEQRASIRVVDSNGSTTHTMPLNRNGEATFTFYEVTEPFSFEIRTPSLRSGRQQVQVFAPPFLDQLRIEIEPPSYTGLPPQTIEGLQDFSAAQGARLRIVAQTRHAREVEWLFNQQGSLLTREPDAQTWILDWLARRSGSVSVRLSNDFDARDSSQVRMTVIPDEPPVVEILHPGRDLQMTPDDLVAFLFYFADDYGLSEATLHVSVAGRRQFSFPMRLQTDEDGNPPREVRMPFGMELESIEAEDGELVSYWVQVGDNREPDAQFTRSEVFFIEVLEESDPEEIDGMPMDQERITLRPQIEELKRLLRLSHRTVTRSGEERLDGNRQLTSALLELRMSIDEVFERIRPMLEEANDQFFTMGFESALALVDSARDLITDNRTELAIPAQEQALQQLLAMENALISEQISREPAEGEGEGEGQGEDGESGEDSQQPDALMALNDALERVRELQRGQDSQNSQTDRAGRTGVAGEQLNALAQSQDALRRELSAVDRDIARVPDTAEVRGSLLQSEQRMRGAAAGLRGSDAQLGWREGTRAGDHLENAARLLQDMIDAALSEGLAALQAEAGQLAGDQQQAADATSAAQRAGGGEQLADALLEQQEQLNERLQQLLQNMEQMGQGLQGTQPESARALTQAARQARSGNPGSAMTRSANALLYEFLAEAGELQAEAAQGLQGLAEAIGAAGRQLPGITARQLERLQQELQRDQGTLAGLGAADDEQMLAEQLESIRAQWEQRLQNLARQTGDRQLPGLADALGMGSGATDAQLRETQHILDRADSIIDAYRQMLQRRQVLDLRRRSAPPPERFREQVESYFRQLAEE